MAVVTAKAVNDVLWLPFDMRSNIIVTVLMATMRWKRVIKPSKSSAVPH